MDCYILLGANELNISYKMWHFQIVKWMYIMTEGQQF